MNHAEYVGVEKLDKLYQCAKCAAVFLFKDDVRDHERLTSHDDFYIKPI